MSLGSQFVPAKSKLEAVGRISNLTGSGPEELGPGSKERKRVLVNLANGLNLGINSESLSKQDLGKSILNSLGGTWASDCESTGQTVTLIGLNRILEFSESHFKKSIKPNSWGSINDEANSILSIARKSIPKNWIGKDCVIEMKDGGSSKWRHTEWQGFYFEFRAIGHLVNELGGGPVKIGATEFDYELQTVWDLKVHSNFGLAGPKKLNKACPLNDQLAMRQVVEGGGLGLVVLSGNPTYSIEFSKWHKEFRGKPGEPIKQLKEVFTPTHLEAFFIPDESALEGALRDGLLSHFAQGKQQNGAPRKPKYSLDISKARGSGIQIAELII